MFLECKTVVQLAIGLDLTTNQGLKIHSDYLILRNMEMASRVLKENRKNLEGYMKMIDFLEVDSVKAGDSIMR